MSVTESKTYNLSAEERQFLDDNGYLVIKGLIEPSVLDNCRKRFLEIVNKKEGPRSQISRVKDLELMKKTDNPEEYVNKIHQLNFDEVFAQYTEHPRLLHVLAQLVGPELVSMNSMLINKPPGSPWHPPHQDVYSLPYKPYNFLTSWTAIDPADVDNGCLFVVPGSHKPNKIHEEELVPGLVNHLFFTIKDVEQVAPVERRVSLPVQPGDTVILHAMTVHGSWPNHSQRYRKAITCIYGDTSSKYFEVDGTVQEPFKAGIEEVLREMKLTSIWASYEKFWESRRKILTPINL